MEKLNPFQNLCVSNGSKDINENFLNTLQTIKEFAGDFIATNINKSIARRVFAKINPLEQHPTYFDEMIRLGQAIEQENTIPTKQNGLLQIEFKQEAHLGDFLIFKLIENLRRLYSANRNGGDYYYQRTQEQKEYSINSLNEQQRNIYKCFNEIKDYILFDNKINFFKGSFLGQNKTAHKADLFFFLGFHENILPEHEELHIELFNKFFSTQILDINFLQEELLQVSYPQRKQNHIHKLLSLLPDDIFTLIANKISENHKKIRISSISIDCFFEIAKKKIPIDIDSKKGFILKILANDSFFKTREISQSDIDSFKHYISNIENVEEKILETINRSSGASEEFYLFCAKLLDKINCPNLFINILSNKFTHDVQTELINKYDLTNQDFIFNAARIIVNQKNKNVDLLNKLFSYSEPFIKNETVANIISLDSNLITEIAPIIMKLKLKTNLAEKEVDKKSQKLKI